MKKILILVLFSASFFAAFAVTPKLSKYAQLSILTCGPGQELYSTFGHSALRILDPANSIDLVYNYGAFNVQQQGFYVKFVKGRLNYMISLSYFDQFMYEYRVDKRSVVEQVLNLSYEQKQKIFEYLEWNHKPENKYYLYDFFFDNCATRFRDLMPKVLGQNNISYDQSIEQNHQTFRDLLDLYLDKSPWEHFGINIVLGAPTDRIAKAADYMFLPDYLHDAFAKATIKDSLGHKLPLVQAERITFKPDALPEVAYSILTPASIGWFLFVVFSFITFFEWKRKFYSPVVASLDVLYFFVLGLVGALIVFLWFFTDHKVVVKNWNIAWAIPFHLICCFFLGFKKMPNLVRSYLFFVFGITILLFIFWKLLPQRLDLNFIPFLLVVAMRSYTLAKLRK